MQIGRPAFSVVASGGKLTVTPVEKQPRRNLLLHMQLRKEAGVGIEPTFRFEGLSENAIVHFKSLTAFSDKELALRYYTDLYDIRWRAFIFSLANRTGIAV